MGAEQRHEGAELVPAGLQFLPLGLVRRIIELGHHAETADIHAPERDAAHGVVQARRHLHPHIRPGGADVAAPGRRRVPLQAGKPVAGQQEDPLVGIHAALTVVDRIRVDQGIGIEILGRGAQGIRGQQPFEVIPRQAVAQVRFAGIHPPRIDLAAEPAVQGLVHLPPEHLASSLGIGIIETLVMAQPVFQGILFGVQVDIARILQFLVMIRIRIEFRPDTDHEPPVHRMHVIHHLLRIRIAGRLEFVAAPLVILPILPVLDDIVHRNVPLPEFRQGANQFILSRIPLPALPEAHDPLRHDRCLSGQRPIAMDHLVIVLAGNEIEIRLRLELRPESGLLLLLGRPVIRHAQAQIRSTAVRVPFNPDRGTFPGLQMFDELIAVRIPGRTPPAGHHFFSADFGLLEPGIILDKMVVTLMWCFQPALIDHLRALQRDLRQVPDGPFILEEQAVFPTDHGPGHQARTHPAAHVGAGQSALSTVLIIEFKHLAQLAVRLRIAPAAQRIRIEQQAVTSGGNHERNAHLGIVLEQFLAAALVVELPGLVLAQAIERLVLAADAILQADRPGLLPFHLDGRERQMPVALEQITFFIVMPEGAVRTYDHRTSRGLHPDRAGFFPGSGRHRELLIGLLREDHQALPVMDFSIRCSADPQEFISENLNPDLRGLSLLGLRHRYRHLVPPYLISFVPTTGQDRARQQDASGEIKTLNQDTPFPRKM